jgi:hypothetical protein
MRYVKSNSNISVLRGPAAISKFIYERILVLGVTLTHGLVNLYLDSEDVYLLQAKHDISYHAPSTPTPYPKQADSAIFVSTGSVVAFTKLPR